MPEAIPNLGPDLLRCPRCGAGNPAGATWCGQCLSRFDGSDEAHPEPRFAAADGRRAAGRSPVVRAVEDGEPRWICPACETENVLSASECERCGSMFVSFFGDAKVTEAPKVSSMTAVGLSAALPGLGNWAYRQAGPAVARAVLYVWTLGMSILLLARPPVKGRGIVLGVGAVFALAAASVWLLSMTETLRLGRGDERPVIPPKALTWFAAGLSGFLMLGLLGAVIVGR